jgi:hypothetical protein
LTLGETLGWREICFVDRDGGDLIGGDLLETIDWRKEQGASS